MSDTPRYILTDAEATTLREARAVADAVRKRLINSVAVNMEPWLASRTGYVEHAIETAGDAIFEALNCATHNGGCQNAGRALDILLDRVPRPLVAAVPEAS